MYAWITRNWLLLSVFAMVVVTVLSLYPLPKLPSVPGSDKLHHLIGYAGIFFPIALRQPKHWQWVGVIILCFSGVIELIQPLVNRYGEVADMIANGLGILIGGGLGYLTKHLITLHQRNH